MSKEYTWEEIAKHKDPKTSLWIVINNGVYDVTSWAENHPGGKDVLADFAGRDASKGYYGHSVNADKQAEQFKIGELKKDEQSKEQQS